MPLTLPMKRTIAFWMVNGLNSNEIVQRFKEKFWDKINSNDLDEWESDVRDFILTGSAMWFSTQSDNLYICRTCERRCMLRPSSSDDPPEDCPYDIRHPVWEIFNYE